MTTSLALLLLSIIGALDAAYLSYVHLFSSGACGAGSGCSALMGSPFSRIAHVPLATIGLGLYLAMIVASWRSFRPDVRAESIRWVSLLAVLGNCPTAFLVYVQAFVIEVWCPFCLLSTVLILSILIVSILARKSNGTLRPFVGSLVSLDLVPVATVIVIVPILFAVMEKGASSSASVSEPETSEVVARIRDREITLVEMDRGILLKLYETRTEYRQEWLDKELLKTAAEKKGLEVREFVQTEVYRAIEISQEEIDQRYEEIKGRLPKNVSKEMVTKNIRGQLGNRKSQSALDAYVGQLKKEYGTTYVAPASERFAFDPNPRGGPEKGSPDARVTIVEFSDLQCGYCSRAHTYLNDLLERRGNDIRLIFKHLPLDMHDHATYAAAVAACAHRQGKFWPLADILFREQKHLEKDNIMSYAESAELDLDQLNMCLDTDEGAGEVTADIAEANDLGISSTPSFFINGHYIGSLPKGGLDHLIDRELAAYR